MTKSSAQYVMSVSDDGVIVKVDFLSNRKDKCQHRNIEFTRLDNELTCQDCGAKINPVTWLADNAEQIYRQTTRPPKPTRLEK